MRQLLVLFVLIISACVATDQLDPGESEDVASDGKTDGTGIQLGTYALSPYYTVYWELTLAASNEYSLRGGCNTPGCDTITHDRGHYKLTHVGAKKYLRLYSDDQNGALVARFAYVLTAAGVKLTDTDDNKAYTGTLQADATSAAALLQSDIGTKTLVCVPSLGDPSKYALTVRGPQIEVTAKNSRGGVYAIDTAKISGGNMRLSLSNGTDGPLAEDLLVFATSDLAKLATGATTVAGSDTYSEQFDGTTSKYVLACKLE